VPQQVLPAPLRRQLELPLPPWVLLRQEQQAPLLRLPA
jgi:hypothetical protein